MLTLGGYLIEARRTSAWDAIVDLLTFLEGERPDFFHRVTRGCLDLSNGPREEDGCHDLPDDRHQHMADLAFDRETRRDERGFATPAQARAFLREARELRFDFDRAPESAVTRAYFRGLESSAETVETRSKPGLPLPSSRSATTSARDAYSAAAIFEVLEDAGLVATRPRGLLGAASDETLVLRLVQRHAASHSTSEEELAYLANVLLAGCSIQGRRFTIREASECAAGVCNLGLENWPSNWTERDLIAAFQVGWTLLHRDVCMDAAHRLIDVLTTLRWQDREIQLRLDVLRRELIQHLKTGEPWQAGDALDALLMLDPIAWAALRGLIGECPVIHAGLHASRQARLAVKPTDFEFITQMSQIAAVREFLANLPSLLSGN